MKFTELPDCILDRIAFHVFLESGLKDVVSLSRTCSFLHEHYMGFFLTVKPLNVRKKPKNNSITYAKLDEMKLSSLYFVRDLRLFDFSKKEFSFSAFPELGVLSLQTNEFSFLTQLHKLPRLYSLTIMYNNRKVRSSKFFKSLTSLVQQIEEQEFPALQVFRVASHRAKVNKPFRHLVSPNWQNPVTREDYDKQFASEKWGKVLSPFQRKHSALGALFFKVMERTRTTLRVVEVLGLDFSFLMGATRTIKFSKNCNIILNSPSLVHSSTWISRIKVKTRVSILIEDEMASAVKVIVLKKNKEPVRSTKGRQLLVDVRRRIDTALQG